MMTSPRFCRKIIMHVRATALGSAAATAVIIGLITGCSGPASFAERMAYLKTVANQGVQTHNLIVSEGGTTTAQRCTDAYSGLQDQQNAPDDVGYDAGPSQDWLNQIQAFFVESCTTGLPKAVPAMPTGSPTTSSSS
jgi:hypothetical protein